MFVQLIESRARSQKRIGGSLASMVVHAVIIGSAVVLTANAGIVEEDDEPVEFVEQFVNVEPPPPTHPLTAATAASPGATMSVRPALSLSLTLPAIAEIPVTIPPVDAGARDVNVDDFARGPGGYGDGVASGLSRDGAPGIGNVFSAAQVDKPVVMRAGTKPPLYPDVLQQSGVEGGVLVQFVVDTLGHIDMRTVEVISSDHELFTNAVRSSMAHMRFVPAEFRGQKVSQLVRQPFRFDLNR